MTSAALPPLDDKGPVSRRRGAGGNLCQVTKQGRERQTSPQCGQARTVFVQGHGQFLLVLATNTKAAQTGALNTRQRWRCQGTCTGNGRGLYKVTGPIHSGSTPLTESPPVLPSSRTGWGRGPCTVLRDLSPPACWPVPGGVGDSALLDPGRVRCGGSVTAVPPRQGCRPTCCPCALRPSESSCLSLSHGSLTPPPVLAPQGFGARSLHQAGTLRRPCCRARHAWESLPRGL